MLADTYITKLAAIGIVAVPAGNGGGQPRLGKRYPQGLHYCSCTAVSNLLGRPIQCRLAVRLEAL
jgi:hypothetical protein